MTDGVYRPILRPRRGELAALHHLDADAAKLVMPIIELSPTEQLPQLVRKMPPRTGAIAVDLGAIGDPWDPLSSPPLDLAEELADVGVAMLPVLRAYDSPRRLLEHGLAARMHLMRAVLRLQPHLDARNAVTATALTDRMLAGARPGVRPRRPGDRPGRDRLHRARQPVRGAGPQRAALGAGVALAVGDHRGRRDAAEPRRPADR
nr:hypothetical protein GCM10020092_096000 [Actinoplanes digitatis]